MARRRKQFQIRMQNLFRHYKYDADGNELSVADIYRECEKFCENERNENRMNKLSISKQYLQAIDSGQAPSNPTLTKLYVISKVMGIPFGSIMSAYGMMIGEVSDQESEAFNRTSIHLANQLETIAQQIKRDIQN